jgi:glycosyltransferase involved in cell wall biosynthesis
MKITYLSSGYPPDLGGVERHVAELASRMAADGHAVQVLAQRRGGQTLTADRIDGVIVRRFPVRLSAPALAVTPWRELSLSRGVDEIVHAHNYHSAASLAPALAARAPLVFTPHYLGTGENMLPRLLHAGYRPFGRLVFRCSDRIICVSRAEASLLRQHFRSSATPITVVPNAVDADELRRARPHPVEGTAILTAGRLAAYKNVGLTLEAVRHLSEEFRLYVAGDGPERERLHRASRRAGVEQRVVFLGRLDPPDLHRWFRTARVYVTLSPRECFGITLLEALVAGAGTVASNIAAHREVVARSGARAVVLVPPWIGPLELAGAIRHVARRTDGVGAATEPPSWDAVAERHLQIYHSLTRG